MYILGFKLDVTTLMWVIFNKLSSNEWIKTSQLLDFENGSECTRNLQHKLEKLLFLRFFIFYQKFLKALKTLQSNSFRCLSQRMPNPHNLSNRLNHFLFSFRRMLFFLLVSLYYTPPHTHIFFPWWRALVNILAKIKCLPLKFVSASVICHIAWTHLMTTNAE